MIPLICKMLSQKNGILKVTFSVLLKRAVFFRNFHLSDQFLHMYLFFALLLLDFFLDILIIWDFRASQPEGLFITLRFE